ncbi:MAG: ATP-binding protein [Bacteroidota bacterium]|jgi:serine/threonine-protein kinase RsbW
MVASTHKIQLESNYQSLSAVEKFIEEVCEENNIGENNFGNILVAVTEAVNNAIQHGNRLDPSKKIEMEAEAIGSAIQFKISDQGKGFDFSNIPDPTEPQNLEKPNGRGVFLMKNLADAVSFEENGRIVHLKFNAIN